jgi:hypothetical protein
LRLSCETPDYSEKNKAEMDALKQYLLPYIVSNLLFLLCLIAAFKRPIWARIFLAIVFLWASYINFRTAFLNPEVYLEYAVLTPLPAYREFINGFFSQHIGSLVSAAATGEFLIFGGLLLNNGWVRLACVGGIIFGLAISPLGVGSAFPATVLMAMSFWVLLKKDGHTYIWNWRQYRPLNHNSLIE